MQELTHLRKTDATTTELTPTLRPVICNVALTVYQQTQAPKIRTIAAQDGDGAAGFEIGKWLVLVYEAIGVRTDLLPSDISKGLIGRFIFKNYAFLAPGEIFDAFIYALEGKYPEPVDLELYGKPVSIAYIQPVLKQYVRYRNDQLTKATKQLAAAERDEVREVLSGRPKSDEAVKSLLLEAFISIQAPGISLYSTPLLPEFYDYLDAAGLITLSTEEKNWLLQRAKEQLATEAADERRTIKKVIAGENGPIDRAKKLSIIEQFTLWSVAGLDELFLLDLFDRVCFISIQEHKRLYMAQHGFTN